MINIRLGIRVGSLRAVVCEVFWTHRKQDMFEWFCSFVTYQSLYYFILNETNSDLTSKRTSVVTGENCRHALIFSFATNPVITRNLLRKSLMIVSACIV